MRLPADVSFDESEGPNGEKQLVFLIEEKVRNMIHSGRLDRAMSTTYGISRRGY